MSFIRLEDLEGLSDEEKGKVLRGCDGIIINEEMTIDEFLIRYKEMGMYKDAALPDTPR